MVPNLIIFTFYCSMERSSTLCNWKSSSLPTCVIYFQNGNIAYQHHCARLHACHQPLSERASICILTPALTKRRANKSCLWHLRNVFSNLSMSRTSWMAVQGLHSPHLHRFSKCSIWQSVQCRAWIISNSVPPSRKSKGMKRIFKWDIPVVLNIS